MTTKLEGVRVLVVGPLKNDFFAAFLIQLKIKKNILVKKQGKTETWVKVQPPPPFPSDTTKENFTDIKLGLIKGFFPGEASVAEIMDNNKQLRSHVKQIMEKSGKVDYHWQCTDGTVVVIYHVNIVVIGHGLLKKFWPLVLGCVLRTHCREFNYRSKQCLKHIKLRISFYTCAPISALTSELSTMGFDQKTIR